MPRVSLSQAQARRVAIAAQKLAPASLDDEASVRRIRGSIRALGVLQLDFVNVLVPAHRFVAFSRSGAHEPETFHRAVYTQRQFTEHWAHEACIVPMTAWPLLEYRRKGYRPWPRSPILSVRNRKRYLSDIIEIIDKKGSVTANDLPQLAPPIRKDGDWKRSVARSALDYLFGHGEIAVRSRLPNFQRVYDIAERVIPRQHFERSVATDDAKRELILQAAKAHGVATLRDLADYYRMTGREAAPCVRELVESGDLCEVDVEGWSDSAFLDARARVPRRINGCTLLSPFDPLVWYRPRTERLFDFHYRIEIYVPAAKRRWGYYVLPFLLNDRLVARVDLKADRGESRLLVPAAHLENDCELTATAEALAGELWRVAAWLGLDTVAVGRRGNLSRSLRTAVSRQRTRR